MTAPPANGAVVEVRLANLEKAIERKADNDDVDRLLDEMKSIRRLLTGLLVSIAVAAIGALFTIVQLGGHP